MSERKQPESANNALRLRANVKHKKPAFVRPESWRYDKFSQSWRRPRGLDNKIRRKIKGWPPSPGVGYRGPKGVRGLHPSGYDEVIVHNVDELGKIEAETMAVRIAHTVGKQKRIQIIAEAKKLNLVILNAKVKTAEKTEEAEEVKETAAEKETPGKKEAEEEKKEAQKKASKKKAKKEAE